MPKGNNSSKTGQKSAPKSSTKASSKKGGTGVRAGHSDKGSPNPSKPSYDSHPGAHDTKSQPNPTLNENGTTKWKHGMPEMTSEEVSKKGADTFIAKMHQSKKNKKK